MHDERLEDVPRKHSHLEGEVREIERLRDEVARLERQLAYYRANWTGPDHRVKR